MTDPQSPEAAPGLSSRKNSSVHKHNHASENARLQEAGFSSSSAFEQQNRWMIPLPPQESNICRSTNLATSNTLNSHDGYNTIPPMPMNCTKANPPGLSFSSVNPFVNNPATSAAYATVPAYKASQGHLPVGHDFEVKLEPTYM